jgi:cell division protease FtsH
MVTRWGFSEKLGPLAYQEEEGEVFLGRSVTQHKHASDETARQIDEEVRAIIDRNYERTRRLLTEHVDKLHAMAAALMEYESLSSEQIDDIMAGRAPRTVAPRNPDRDGAVPARPGAAGGTVGPALPGTR